MTTHVQAAIKAIGHGRPVLVLIPNHTYNSGQLYGSLLLGAHGATPEAINIMVREGRGIISVGLTAARCQQLHLQPMVQSAADEGAATAKHGVCIVSVDAKHNITTGISAADRAYTVHLLAAADTAPTDLVVPGHIFPYVTHPDGVAGRPGEAEAAVYLAEQAGLPPVGAFCGVLNKNGSLANRDDLLAMATRLDIPVITMQQLIDHQLMTTSFVQQKESTTLNTDTGPLTMTVFHDTLHDEEHVVLHADHGTKPPYVVVHRQTAQHDVFQQPDALTKARQFITAYGGYLIYVGRRTPAGNPLAAVTKHVLSSFGETTVRWPHHHTAMPAELAATGLFDSDKIAVADESEAVAVNS